MFFIQRVAMEVHGSYSIFKILRKSIFFNMLKMLSFIGITRDTLFLNVYGNYDILIWKKRKNLYLISKL